jgi:hypothetical protein
MSNVKRFIARYKIEDIRMPLNDEGVKMWRSVAEALELSPDQSAATAQLWRSFRCLLQCRELACVFSVLSYAPISLCCRVWGRPVPEHDAMGVQSLLPVLMHWRRSAALRDVYQRAERSISGMDV